MANIAHNLDPIARALALEALQKDPGPAPSTDNILYLIPQVPLPLAPGGTPIMVGSSIPCQTLWRGATLPGGAALRDVAPDITGCTVLYNTVGDGETKPSFITLPTTMTWQFLEEPASPSQLTAASISFVDTDGSVRYGTLSWDDELHSFNFTLASHTCEGQPLVLELDPHSIATQQTSVFETRDGLSGKLYYKGALVKSGLGDVLAAAGTLRVNISGTWNGGGKWAFSADATVQRQYTEQGVFVNNNTKLTLLDNVGNVIKANIQLVNSDGLVAFAQVQ